MKITKKMLKEEASRFHYEITFPKMRLNGNCAVRIDGELLTAPQAIKRFFGIDAKVSGGLR